MKKLITVAFGLIVLLWLVDRLDISYPIRITTSNRSTELSVVGEGKIDVIPDTAYVDLGVTVSNGLSVEAVQKEIDAKNNAIIAALKSEGFNEGDIKTSNYSVYPNYEYDGRTNKISGYNGNVIITVKSKDTTKSSKIIELGTKNGANQVSGVRFDVENPDKYREQARQLAIDNAREQAQKLASTLGIKLGKVVNFMESTPETLPPVLTRTEAVGLGGGGADIQPGSQTITSVVTLYFEKQR